MNSLPHPLGSGEIRFWRIDDERHAETWNSGEGSFRVGARWNSPGVRTVYTSIDPSTAILEVAAHKTFRVLDMKPHVMTTARVSDPTKIHVVQPKDVPNPNWLLPSAHGGGQCEFGDELLEEHTFVLIPSTISRSSWNLIFESEKAEGLFDDVRQERFALDPRLHPKR